MSENAIREALGVFQSEAALQSAADELLIAGFDRADLSLLASAHAVEQKLGHAYRCVAEIEDDPALPKRAYAGPDSRTEAEGAIASGLVYVGAVGTIGAVVASGGAVVTALVGATLVGGAGGLIGLMLARFIEQRHVRELQMHLDRGGLLLWVRTADEDHESRACEILRRAGAQNVHVSNLRDFDYAQEARTSQRPDALFHSGASTPAKDVCSKNPEAN